MLADDVGQSAEDRTHDLAEHAPRVSLRIFLSGAGMVGGDVAGLVAKREGEFGFIVHQGHQLARDVDVAARHRHRVLDRRVEHREVNRLPGVGDAGISRNPAADRCHIGRARASLGAPELFDDRGILALGLGDVARIEIARPLCACRGESDGARRQQEQGFTHACLHCREIIPRRF